MRIYLDHNATTPVHASVRDAMVRTLTQEDFGNPSSVHYYGQRAKSSVDDARAAVAGLIGADPGDVIFTSGGTESDNLALRGALDARAAEPNGRRHLVISAIEHEAVLNTARALEKLGWPVTIVPVGASGVVEAADLAAAVTEKTALVSLMHANNEVGTIQPILEAAAIAKAAGAWVHTDAVQSAGKLPIAAREWAPLGVDLISVSAHKFGGPKGVGALWIRRGVKLSPTATGGRHERNRRAGTENVSGIAGLGAAASVARASLAAHAAHVAQLRDRLESSILANVPGTVVNGDAARRLPNTSNISFDGVEAESLLIALDLEEIAVSTGAACSSGTLEPSHVLKAMGLPHPRTKNSLRFSLGPENTASESDRGAGVLPALV
ncbi:MAG: cysteine desulfurase, partial [Acidobacteria bacterium]|nr:cysteine desulfurase [Acidobacteriota bacterium]